MTPKLTHKLLQDKEEAVAALLTQRNGESGVGGIERGRTKPPIMRQQVAQPFLGKPGRCGSVS
jgi:hypothetical protein